MRYPVRTTQQLGPVLKGLRKANGFTQSYTGVAGGLMQKTVSLMETDPGRCSVESLMRYLSAIGVTLELDQPPPGPDKAGSPTPSAVTTGKARKPSW